MWLVSLILAVLMAFKVEVGHFTKETGGAANATQTVTLVDATLTPKVLFLWCTGQTATGFTVDSLKSIGMGTGTALANQRCASSFSFDATTTSDVAASWYDGVLVIFSTTAAPAVRGRINAFSAGSFQMIYPVNNTTAYIIQYMVLGGDDLTNALMLEKAAPTVAGNRDDTGFGFQGDCVVFLHAHTIALGEVIEHRFMLGAAQSSTKLWAIANTGRDNQGMTANMGAVSSQRSDACWLALTLAAAPVVEGNSGFVGFVADGYTLNWADAPAAAVLYAALALKGGQYAVDVFDKSIGAAPATQDVTTVGFDPSGFILASRDAVAGTTVDGNSELSLGASDSVRERHIWANWDDNVLTEAARRVLNTNVLSLCRADPGASVEESLADHTADLSNGFRLVWNPNEAVAKQICYAAFGDAPVVLAEQVRMAVRENPLDWWNLTRRT